MMDGLEEALKKSRDKGLNKASWVPKIWEQPIECLNWGK
jgi:hypothetical protein